MLSQPAEMPRELVMGLLHQGGKMVVGGGSKSFKTWLLAYLALCVATGREWLGFETVAGRVLYINLEIQRGFFRNRLDEIGKAIGRQPRPGEFEVWNLRGHAADMSLLIGQILERVGQKYALIIIDPIYKVLGGRDENAAGDIGGLLNELERLAVQSEAAVVFGAHFSKGNQSAKESMDRIGGSGVFARDPDTILVLTRHEEEDAFAVETTLRNHPPVAPFVVRWQFPLMRRDGALDPSKLRQVQGRPKIHDADDLFDVLSDDDEMTYGEWLAAAKEHAGMGKATFTELKSVLFKAGRVAQSKLTRKYYKVGKVGK